MSNLPDDFEVTHIKRELRRGKDTPRENLNEEGQLQLEFAAAKTISGHDPRNHTGKHARLIWPTHHNDTRI